MFTEGLRVTKQEQLNFRLVSIILALVIALSILPNVAMAAPVPVSSNLSTLSLETNSAMVTQGKVKVNGIRPYANLFFATSGQVAAQTPPEEGIAFSTFADLYSYKLNYNLFVPASPGEVISIVEVDEQSNKVIGFTSLVVGAIHMGTVQPLVDLGYQNYEIVRGTAYTLHDHVLFDAPNGASFYNPSVSSFGVALPTLIPNEITLHGYSPGITNISFDVVDNLTGDRIRKTITVTVLAYSPPSLYKSSDYLFTEGPVSISLSPRSSLWELEEIEINGTIILKENYSYVTGVNIRDTIVFEAGVLSEGRNVIVLKSDEHQDGIIELQIHKSEQSFYMSEPLINKRNGGLSASIKMARNINNDSYHGKATVIFQLMNGNTPVETVLSTRAALNDFETSHAQFNIDDAMTNPNYSVRAFLITGDNTDVNHMGYNLATQVNAVEFEKHSEELKNWQ